MFVHVIAFRASMAIDDGSVVARVMSAAAESDVGRRVTVDLPVAPELYDRLGRRPNVAPAWNALVQVVVDDPARRQGEALAHALSDALEVVAGWTVRRDVVWSRAPEVSYGSAVKQVSFVAKPVELRPDEFEDRYRGHQGVAIEHHDGAFRYVQNVVLDHTSNDGHAAAAISEMWFASEAALIHRYYTTPDSRAVTQADSQTFLDPRRTTWLLVRPQSLE